MISSTFNMLIGYVRNTSLMEQSFIEFFLVVLCQIVGMVTLSLLTICFRVFYFNCNVPVGDKHSRQTHTWTPPFGLRTYLYVGGAIREFPPTCLLLVSYNVDCRQL